MQEKITKKNSIIFNQLWINKAIEEGNIRLLPWTKPDDLSIGEFIEKQYENIEETEQIKINKHNSMLFLREWKEKYIEEGLRIPSRKITTDKYSLGEILALRYFEREILLKKQEETKNKCLKLNS